MSLFDDFLAGEDDLLLYEICFPGAVTGETEIECPHCQTLLTVPVEDPMGEEEVYQCHECAGVFEVDWLARQIRYLEME